MITNQNLHRGVIVPMSTPFTPAGDVDETAVERIADRLAAHELSAFPLGTTGENSSIPAAQRERVVAATVRAVAGRVPVYAGIGDNCLADSVAAGKRYLKLGVAAVVAHMPSYYPITSEDMHAYFVRLHDELDGPLMLYNIPITTRMSLPLDVVERLSQLRNVVGFKDSEGTAGRIEETAKRFGGRPNFKILMGVAALSTAALKVGFDGLVPSSGNLVPALWQRYWKEASAKNWPAAEALQQQLDGISAVLQKNRGLGGYLAAMKIALAAQKMCFGHGPPSHSHPLARREGASGDRPPRDAVDLTDGPADFSRRGRFDRRLRNRRCRASPRYPFFGYTGNPHESVRLPFGHR